MELFQIIQNNALLIWTVRILTLSVVDIQLHKVVTSRVMHVEGTLSNKFQLEKVELSPVVSGSNVHLSQTLLSPTTLLLANVAATVPMFTLTAALL